MLIQRRCNFVQPRIEGVHQDQSVLCEKPRKQFAKRAAVSLFRPVTFRQILRQQVAAAVRQHFCGFLHQWLDLFSERNPSHRPSYFPTGRQFKTDQFSLVEPSCMADFVEIVIFRGHPKNRHCGDSTARQLFGNLHGAERLINGISGPAEQPHLLSRYDGGCAFLQPVQVGQRFRACPKRHVLSAKNGSYFCSSIVRVC